VFLLDSLLQTELAQDVVVENALAAIERGAGAAEPQPFAA
jgi:hypothetical protein